MESQDVYCYECEEFVLKQNFDWEARVCKECKSRLGIVNRR